MNEKNSLEYIYISDIPKEGENKPLLILLHGYGADKYNLLSLTDAFPDYFVVSLKAPIMQSMLGSSWCDIYYKDGQKSYDLEQLEESRQKVFEFIEYIISEYNVDSSDVNLLGFSQGAVMAHSLALTKPELFKSVITLSGFIYEDYINPILGDIEKIKELNIFIGHGGKDTIVPVEKDVKSTELLDTHDVKYTFKEYGIGHEISPEEIKDVQEWLKETKIN